MNALEATSGSSSLKVFIAFVPPLIWLLYFRERESFVTPFRAVWVALLCGAAVTYPAGLIQNFLSNSPDISFRWFYELALIKALTVDGINPQYVVESIVYGGVIEESLKLAAVFLVFGALRSSLRAADLAIIGIAVGCGFAIVENFMRYFEMADWQRGAWSRSLMGAHVFYGAIMGSFLAFGFMRCGSYLMFVMAFAVPILLHATYNQALAMNVVSGEAGELSRVVFTAVVLISALMALFLTRRVWSLDLVTRQGSSAPATHFWMKHPRLRAWVWRSLSLLLGALGVLFLSWGGFSYGESSVLAVLALSMSLLFGLHRTRI